MFPGLPRVHCTMIDYNLSNVSQSTLLYNFSDVYYTTLIITLQMFPTLLYITLRSNCDVSLLCTH